MSDKKLMESIIYCPACSEEVRIVLSPYQEKVDGIFEMFERSLGGGSRKTETFEGEGKCRCGLTVTGSLRVTAREEGSRNIQVRQLN
jgi:hypothetical protein